MGLKMRLRSCPLGIVKCFLALIRTRINLSNILPIIFRLKDLESKQVNGMIVLTHEYNVSDSLNVRRKDKRRSFRKSLCLSPAPTQALHRANIKSRAFSPINDAQRDMFSPLIKDPMNTKITNVKTNVPSTVIDKQVRRPSKGS